MSFDFTLPEPQTDATAEAEAPISEPEKGLIVTDAAAEMILKLLTGEGKSVQEHALRIAVLGGGCSGYMYDIRFDEPTADDYVYCNGEARVCIDPKSVSLIDGAKVEYLHRLQGAGFTVINPNSTGSCGCGLSFSV